MNKRLIALLAGVTASSALVVVAQGSGVIRVDGSSTVYPFTLAVA